MKNANQARLSPMPIEPAREAALLNLSRGVNASALRYMAGFLVGIAAEREQAADTTAFDPGVAASTESAAHATVLFASQTGNGRRIAERLHRQLESQGLSARIVSTADFRPRELAAERLLYVVASTHGDGEPPDDARELFDFLNGRKAQRLERLSYSVLSLGDSGYPKFCETGRQLDERLQTLGARRLAPRADCDVDFETAADVWTQHAVALARTHLQSPHIAIISTVPVASAATAGRDNPIEIELLASTRLTGRGSQRAIVHLEAAAPSPQLDYEPGDAVGIWHANPQFVADDLAAAIGADPESRVALDGIERTLREWLVQHREITRLSRPFLDAHARQAASPELDALRSTNDGTGLRDLLRYWQPLDLLERWTGAWTPEDLVRALRPLTPRLYSIASSREAVGNELHLTVAAVEYARGAAQRVGAASRYLTTMDPATDSPLRAYIEPNPRFRLPADPSRDIIMIGPGTGVAPFRGFLQQRIESGASGRNWLFFGGRHFASDFLYQTEWLEARRSGTLHRLDVAFSRDQREKVYVQHRLTEQGAELLQWIEGGAHIYVCGDAQHMARDVHAALRAALVTHGGRSEERAEAQLAQLANERRYARDVY